LWKEVEVLKKLCGVGWGWWGDVMVVWSGVVEWVGFLRLSDMHSEGGRKLALRSGTL
jgi:hypothetical protein